GARGSEFELDALEEFSMVRRVRLPQRFVRRVRRPQAALALRARLLARVAGGRRQVEGEGVGSLDLEAVTGRRDLAPGRTGEQVGGELESGAVVELAGHHDLGRRRTEDGGRKGQLLRPPSSVLRPYLCSLRATQAHAGGDHAGAVAGEAED